MDAQFVVVVNLAAVATSVILTAPYVINPDTPEITSTDTTQKQKMNKKNVNEKLT